MPDKSPEYQKVYDEEMKKLDDAAALQATTEPPKVDEVTAPEPKVDTVPAAATAGVETAITAEPGAEDEVAKRLASVEKALADTQRWAHQNAAEVKRLKKEAENREHAANRPEILDSNPGLEEAIRHVSGAPKTKDEAGNWLDTVNAALPDLEAMLESPDFRTLAQQKRTEMGSEWNDPIAATRELGKLQAKYQSEQAVATAVEAARKDFALKQKKSTAMQVPSGGGSKAPAAAVSEVDRINRMSDADFNAMRNKALGF